MVGTGAVFLARHLGLNRLVAIKTLLAGIHASPEDITRFRLEAQSLASLRHTHIVEVYEEVIAKVTQSYEVIE